MRFQVQKQFPRVNQIYGGPLILTPPKAIKRSESKTTAEIQPIALLIYRSAPSFLLSRAVTVVRRKIDAPAASL